jgi:hypothetical protein
MPLLLRSIYSSMPVVASSSSIIIASSPRLPQGNLPAPERWADAAVESSPRGRG